MPASPGALRFNSDSNKLELYDGNQWTEIVASSPDSQTGGARGLIAGGILYPATYYNTIQYITIATTGNSVDFGDLTRKTSAWGALSNSTRGVWGGGYTNAMEFITIASTGNATDFGTLTANRGFTMGASSSTRGLFAGGREPASPNAALNTIDYITILTTGNAVDFGDLYTPTFSHSGLSNGHGGL